MTSKDNNEIIQKVSKRLEQGLNYDDSDKVARLYENVVKRLTDEVKEQLKKKLEKLEKLQNHEARLRRDEHYAKFYDMADRNFPPAYGDLEGELRHSICVGHGLISINFAAKVNQMLSRLHKDDPATTYKNFVLSLKKHPKRIGGGNFSKLVTAGKLENSMEYLLVTHFRDEVSSDIVKLCETALNSARVPN